MKTIINQDAKVLVISHIGDIDGMGSPILASLVFEKIDILLSHADREDQERFYDFIKENINNYEEIYICDLPLPENIADGLNAYKDKIHHFDHHISNIYSSKYSYSQVLVELDNRNTCGTELFYTYLKNRYEIINTNAINRFVELIRSYDTWDWQSNNEYEADDLTTLFELLGPLRFITHYLNFFKENPKEFIFSSLDKDLIMIKNEEKQELLEKAEKTMVMRIINNYNVAIVLCDKFQSIIGNTLCRKYDKIDYIMLIDLSEKKCSLRTIKEIDVSVIAANHGGGGHQKASGYMLNTDDYNQVLDYLKESVLV